jgi:hypothetical protein
LDEQWAESLTAFASRSSVLDQEFEKQGQGRRAVSLTPSSLKRPGNDDWMLPGLGRPGIYSYAKEGKTMQVIPDGRLPYQFSVRTPSPKQKKSADSIVRSDIIPKNVLIVKQAAPALQLDDDFTTEKYPERSSQMPTEVKSANGSRPTSAASGSRPASGARTNGSRPASGARANGSRPASAARTDGSRPASASRPTSAGTAKPDPTRPSSAERLINVLAASDSRISSTTSEPIQIAQQGACEFENDSNADLSSASLQGSEVVLESAGNQATSDFAAEQLAFSLSNPLETGNEKAIEDDSTNKGTGEVMQAGSFPDADAEISYAQFTNSEQRQQIRQNSDSDVSTAHESKAAFEDQSASTDTQQSGTVVEAEQASDSQAAHEAGQAETKDE